MVKQFLFNIGEVVMFVLSSNPSTINRMKARAGGFFKGTVIKETRSMLYIKPLNKDLLDRLRPTSFYRQGWKVKNLFITKEDLLKVGYTLLADEDLSEMDTFYIAQLYNANKAEYMEYVVIPKKQVEHWLGEKRRLNDALDKLRKSHLVKKNTNGQGSGIAPPQKKSDKHPKWTWVYPDPSEQ